MQEEPSELELRTRVVGWVRASMADLGLNQNKLAIKLGVGRPTVHHLLYDGRLGLDLFNRLRTRLHLSANQMLEQDPPAEFRGLLQAPEKPARRAAGYPKSTPIEAAEAGEYVNSIPDPKVRKKVVDAVRKMIPKLKREAELEKKSG